MVTSIAGQARLKNPASYTLTIIIPVYNVEEWICECLDSVFSQITDAVEIVIVDDGTPDRSIDVVYSKYEEWLENDQVVLIRQSNAGPGAARNAGLSVARGEYIGFLDSDDVFIENYIFTVLESIKNFGTDIIEFGFQRFHTISELSAIQYMPQYTFSGLCDLEKVRLEIFSVGDWFPWVRVFKKSRLKNIKFQESTFYEDLMTIPFIYLENLSYYYVDKALIGYRFNPNSTTGLHTYSHAQDIYNFYFSLPEQSSSIAINILKIKTARTFVYFYHELGFQEPPVENVMKNLGYIGKKFELVRHLKLPDVMFFLLPTIYMSVDRLRLRKG